MKNKKLKGVGLGLRSEHASHIIEKKPDIDWLEFVFDNFRGYGGKSLRILKTLSSLYPSSLHCLGMNLGSLDSLDHKYLKDLKELKKITQSAWVSEHLSWSLRNGTYYHDLLPLPFTEEVLKHLEERIDAVQNFLQERILVENISSYLAFSFSEMDEAEFLRALCQRADCFLLLDINNLYVNAYNHNWDPISQLQKIPKERVCQYHLAGHENFSGYRIDSHGQKISEEVWQLLQEALKIIGKRALSIERDRNIPSFEELYEELQKARSLLCSRQSLCIF